MLGILLTALLLWSTSNPAPPPTPETVATKLDGDYTANVWEHVPLVTDFRQRDPKDGAKPTFATDLQVAYDATNLYIAVRAHDPEPQKIVGLRTRRDTQSPSDWIKVIVDSFHDRRTAFEFGVNPAGVKEDRYWYNDGNDDDGWDAVWDVTVARDAEGWRAEFKIPFSQLRFRPADSSTFGFAVVREIGRLSETDTWPLLSKSANGYVSSFADLKDLKLNQTPKRLEAVPYVVGQFDTQPAQPGNPLVATRDQKATVGADLKYALRPGITLTATVNPDFGQVEADPAVVNLTGFETFFAERRPFFLEGSGMFSFDLDCNDGSCSGLFYSRRIGRTPRGSPTLTDGMYADIPTQTAILGAAKLTGHLGRFSFGALNAVTSNEDATIADGAAITHQSVEPLSNYSVVRARREFTNQSTIGFMLTSAIRKVDAPTAFLPQHAFTGGVDWDWRVLKQYAVQGYWVGSSVHGSPDAIQQLVESTVHSFQRPDADYLHENPGQTTLNGDGASLSFSKIGGSRTRFNSNIGFKSPGFDINDIGFLQRADTRSMGNWFQWRDDVPSAWLRSFRFNLNQWGTWNFGGDRLSFGANVNAHWVFKNNWATGAGLNRIFQTFDDRATRGGPGAYANRKWIYWQYVNSDERKPVSGAIFINKGGDQLGSHSLGLSPTVTYRPASFLSLTGGVDWSHNVNDAQWIENTADGHYVFGHLDQTTVGITTRLNYTITPRLTVQIYAQPFVSAGDYSAFKSLVNGRAPRYEDRYAPFAYASNPDFNYRSLRSTNVLRWEYKPGSALFLVWQQGREQTLTNGSFDFGGDFRGVFGVPASNVFLVKWSYWFNP